MKTEDILPGIITGVAIWAIVKIIEYLYNRCTREDAAVKHDNNQPNVGGGHPA